jgi:hypothetical protein
LISALAASATASLATPAMAATEPTTRLVSCQSGSCLVISGRRGSPEAIVLINGHAVAVAGERSWQVRLPLETVRRWSPPMARTIQVATVDPASQASAAQDADLPIGMLGYVELASLVVAVK